MNKLALWKVKMRYVLSVILENCCGCRSCELACAFNHYKECNPSRARIHIVKIEDEGLNNPIVCRQCINPPCMEVCPTKAIFRDAKTEAAQINEELCIGCRACLDACPFGAVFIDPKTSKPIKCDLCNGKPACVEVCPKESIKYTRIDVSPKIKMQSISRKLSNERRKRGI